MTLFQDIIFQEILWLLVCFSWARAINSCLWNKVFHSERREYFLFVILVTTKQMSCHSRNKNENVQKWYESFSKCHKICFCMKVCRSGGGERQNLLSVRDSWGQRGCHYFCTTVVSYFCKPTICDLICKHIFVNEG